MKKKISKDVYLSKNFPLFYVSSSGSGCSSTGGALATLIFHTFFVSFSRRRSGS